MKITITGLLLFIVGTSKGVLYWLEHHLLSCPIKQLTGVDCPGCGFQRSILALFRGEFSRSLELYPATLPIIAMAVFTFAHLKFNFKHGALLIKIFYIITTAIVLIKYIYKIFHHQLT